MFTKPQQNELNAIVTGSLNQAEQIWNQVGDQLVITASARTVIANLSESVETQIPGYPTVEHGKPKVDDFIAIVADMRGSTEHLLCAISQKTAHVSQLQRVFYETSALLPCLAKVISYEEGNVTEYLGDGILGLFCLDKETQRKTIYAANRAANKCLEAVKSFVNPMLNSRYSLPELKIGVGMAYSKAVVTLVGLPNFMQPKVFGECVFRATKLSSGANLVMIDEALKSIWPTAEDGILQFLPRKVNGVDGYIIQQKT